MKLDIIDLDIPIPRKKDDLLAIVYQRQHELKRLMLIKIGAGVAALGAGVGVFWVVAF